jgi:dienelactone hydrolase
MAGSALLSTAASGSVQANVGFERVPVTLDDGAVRLQEVSVRGTCVSASAWTGILCRAYALRTSERAATPFLENGVPVFLEIVTFRPLQAGPYPTLVFHHGSTGNGDIPSLFRETYVNEAVARSFTGRGYQVVFPQRRGRGQSDGLYDEGFEPDRSRYSCAAPLALPGIERALADADVALDHVRVRSDVVADRTWVSGHSRGGLLAIVQSARRPGAYRGVVNFVGGWLGEGCGDAASVNRATLLRGAPSPSPTLWLYAENDPFYSVPFSRGHFDAFRAAGGRGEFRVFTPQPGTNGHYFLDDATLWGAAVEAFLAAN